MKTPESKHPRTDQVRVTIAAGDWRKESDCTECALSHADDLETELTAAQQTIRELQRREQALSMLLATLPTRIAFNENLLAFTNSSMARVQAAKEVVDLHFSKTLSSTPTTSYVPWEVVKEYTDTLNPAIQQKFMNGVIVGSVRERFEAASNKLQSYAPKQPAKAQS